MGDRFETKDSGERQVYATGMQRDSGAKELEPGLIPIPMLVRWAELMGRGAAKYEARNWEKAATAEELDRFQRSAFRHFVQWMRGDTDEDHAAAVFFNISGAEHVKAKLREAAASCSFTIELTGPITLLLPRDADTSLDEVAKAVTDTLDEAAKQVVASWSEPDPFPSTPPPASEAWTPKVGDRVRVNCGNSMLDGKTGAVVRIRDDEDLNYVVEVEDMGAEGRRFCFDPEELELLPTSGAV